MIVYLVSMRDDAPEAVFSTLEAAQAWCPPGDIYVLGPYEVDNPDADLMPWFEAEAGKR